MTIRGCVLERFLLIPLLGVVLFGCAVSDHAVPESAPPITNREMTPDEAKAVLREVGRSWWYGQGIGETALQAGGVILFPPYGLYLLGNAALEMGGYEGVYMTHALPEDDRKDFEKVYDAVTSAPGKLNSTLAGEEFVTREQADKSMERLLSATKVE